VHDPGRPPQPTTGIGDTLTVMDAAPLLLPPNQFPHFYRGGDRIGALRGGPGGPLRPEEWIGSTVTRFGEPSAGLSTLHDGRLLRDAVEADPAAWLGPSHLAAFGPSTELLVKLLDPDQRLPVHVHPDKAFARTHLALDHGKTEAWLVLEAPDGAGVGLGFAEPMRRDHVQDLVSRHDAAALLASLHRLPVRRGDTVLVPAGLPHAIDAGVFVLELQEPTDLSILLEWQDFAVDGERDGHLGLGFGTALDALRLRPLDADERAALLSSDDLRGGGSRSLLAPRADGYFRADLCPGRGLVGAGFAVVLVIEGAGEVRTEQGGTVAVRRGDALVVPWAAGSWRVAGADLVVCRPPLPELARDAP
jgi:mannose-6-phosphate isomerase